MSDTVKPVIPANMDPSAQGMPMFYAAPRPLDRARDAGLHISRPKNFRFASKTNAIPLLVRRIPHGGRHYPIVFAARPPSPSRRPSSALRERREPFHRRKRPVARGRVFARACVRRYPFILMDDPEQKQYVLCIDEKCDMLGTEGEYALFEGENPSAFTKSAMEFCAALRHQGDATDEFVKALQEHDLLMKNDAQIEMPTGARLQLSGFLIVDPKKFDSLPDNIYLTWRRKGWIGLIYAHLLSSHRWQNLVTMAQQVKP